MSPVIRRFEPTDWPAVWSLLQATFQAGDTYAFAPESTEAAIHQAWIEAPSRTFVACDSDGKLLGTYFIKPNQPGLGAHVCNCGYVVAPEAQGQGIATADVRTLASRGRDIGISRDAVQSGRGHQ